MPKSMKRFVEQRNVGHVCSRLKREQMLRITVKTTMMSLNKFYVVFR